MAQIKFRVPIISEVLMDNMQALTCSTVQLEASFLLLSCIIANVGKPLLMTHMNWPVKKQSFCFFPIGQNHGGKLQSSHTQG